AATRPRPPGPPDGASGSPVMGPVVRRLEDSRLGSIMVGRAQPKGESARPAAASIGELRRDQELAERVSLLEQAPLFSVLRGEDMRDLADKFHAIRYRRGEVIFREGEPAERLFLIDDGRVKLTTA